LWALLIVLLLLFVGWKLYILLIERIVFFGQETSIAEERQCHIDKLCGSVGQGNIILNLAPV
jgi:hypothetical protein